MTRPTAELEFVRAPGGRTVLARSRVRAPLAFTRAFDAGDRSGAAEAWLQSTSGGLLAGEHVTVRVTAAPGASVVVAPQSATVVFAAPGGCSADPVRRPARFDLELVVTNGARLVWSPRPTVLVPGASLRSSIVVRVEAGASVLVADAYVQHRPTGPAGRAIVGWPGDDHVGTGAPAVAAQPTVGDFGSLDSSVTVEVDGRLAAGDRQRVRGAWPVPAHGFVWSIGRAAAASDVSPADDRDAIVAELLAAGLAAGALPNGAGVGVRAAGRAEEVSGALGAAIAILRGCGRGRGCGRDDCGGRGDGSGCHGVAAGGLTC